MNAPLDGFSLRFVFTVVLHIGSLKRCRIALPKKEGRIVCQHPNEEYEATKLAARGKFSWLKLYISSVYLICYIDFFSGEIVIYRI